MPIILLLILIVVILLGGAGLIFSLVYGLFVLAWTALPWLAGIVAVMFIASFLKGFGGVSPHQPCTWTEPLSIEDQPEPENTSITPYVGPKFHSNAPSRSERKRLRGQLSLRRRGR